MGFIQRFLYCIYCLNPKCMHDYAQRNDLKFTYSPPNTCSKHCTHADDCVYLELTPLIQAYYSSYAISRSTVPNPTIYYANYTSDIISFSVTMSCYEIQCTTYYTTEYCIMYHRMPNNMMSRKTYNAPHLTTSCHTILYHIQRWYTIPYHIASYNILTHETTLFSSISLNQLS